MTIVWKLKISPHKEKFQMSPNDRCGEIWNSPHMTFVWCRKRYHICKMYVLSCVEKLSPKVHLWGKNDKYQVCPLDIFTMHTIIVQSICCSHQPQWSKWNSAVEKGNTGKWTALSKFVFLYFGGRKKNKKVLSANLPIVVCSIGTACLPDWFAFLVWWSNYEQLDIFKFL